MITIWLKNITFLLPSLVLFCFSMWLILNPSSRLPILRNELFKKQSSIADLDKKNEHMESLNRQLEKELLPFFEIKKSAETGSQEQIAAQFRERIEQAASSSNVKIRSMSDIRRTEVTEGVSLLELNFGADAQIAEIVQFMNLLSINNARVYWKDFSIRPNNQVNVEYLVFNATVNLVLFAPVEPGEGKK